MTITIDIPDTIYRGLQRLAFHEYGDNSPAFVEKVLCENISDVFHSTWQKRRQNRSVSPEEVLAIMEKYGSDNEPDEYDIIEPDEN